jgi:hypothetical protein
MKLGRIGPALAGLASLVALGCRDIDRFDTEGTSAYCGSMVSAPFLNDGFLPENGRPNLSMRLHLDTDALTTYPGTLTTDDQVGICGATPLLTDARLRAIEQVQSDQLSLLEFGDGREYNFFAWVDSCLGPLLAIVSLMKNDAVEVRLLKPRPESGETTPAAERPGFVVFTLKRYTEGCGF